MKHSMQDSELNNHGRRVTHEGNSAITGGDADWIYKDNLTIKNSSDYGVLSADRLENRIAREQVWECSKLVNHSGIEQRRAKLQDSVEIERINVFSITWYFNTNLTKVQISNEVSSREMILVKGSNA